MRECSDYTINQVEAEKKTFDSAQAAKIRDWVKLDPRQLKQVVQNIKQEWDINISTETIKRILKKFCMSWPRMRRGIGGKPDPINKYKEKKEKLSGLKQLKNEKKIDLYSLDESGFCGIPCVPYGWQYIGKYLSIDSRITKRLNVLKIMNRQNIFPAYVSEQTINYDVIIACIATFFAVVERPRFIVVDQASIHTSNAIFDKLEEWK